MTATRRREMGQVRFGLTMSLDGFVAGPKQSLETPLGIGGEELHEWAFRVDAWRRAHGRAGGETNPSSEVVAESIANVGAYLMGRNMFGGGPGPWAEEWRGWGGGGPPLDKPPVLPPPHPPRPRAPAGGPP